jgi:dCTP diphosphatase
VESFNPLDECGNSATHSSSAFICVHLRFHFPILAEKFSAERHGGGNAPPIRMMPMNDSIRDLTSRIQTFVDARDWRQFHNPKDMAVAIAAEAGELMQHFVWQQEDQIQERVKNKRSEIASEVADVGILLFEFADNLGFNLGDVMAEKMARNEERYPVGKSKGNNLKYSEL